MLSYSFSVPVKRKVKRKTVSGTAGKYEILEKGVEGVVYIMLDSSYIIIVGNDRYNIAPENYSCKGVSTVYLQELNDDLRRCRIIRSDRDRLECNPNYVLPFTAGCCVKGNIVKNKVLGNISFNIKKVFIDLEHPDAKDAVKYYRDNYEDISNARNINIEKDYERRIYSREG